VLVGQVRVQRQLHLRESSLGAPEADELADRLRLPLGDDGHRPTVAALCTSEVIDTPPFVGDCYRHEQRFEEVTVMSESTSPETRTKAAEELADRYLALWNEPDADRRRRMIAELWTEDGSHILQPPQEIREIAASPGLGMAAILDARGYEEIEARVASAYEHWVAAEGLSFRGRDDAERLGDVVKFHWEAVGKDGESFGAGLNVLVLGADGRIQRQYTFVDGASAPAT
jgi:hypothetical protein